MKIGSFDQRANMTAIVSHFRGTSGFEQSRRLRDVYLALGGSLRSKSSMLRTISFCCYGVLFCQCLVRGQCTHASRGTGGVEGQGGGVDNAPSN